MVRAFQYLIAILCVGSCAMAATPSIGTVTARGETRIDDYQVKGSGTVFDGSLIETGQSAQSVADVRLAGGSVVTLYIGTRGNVYHDHFVLQQGKVEVTSPGSYRVEVNGLVVTPAGSNSDGIVSIEPGNTVNVVAQTEALKVSGDEGTLIAQVHPGNPLAFGPVSGKPSLDFSATGQVSADHGHYLLKASAVDLTYELKGGNVQNFVGDQVSASGKVDPSASQVNGASATVEANTIVNLALVGRQSPQIKAIISGHSISAADCGSPGGGPPHGSQPPPTKPPPICYGKQYGGLCCPNNKQAESCPPLCCPGDNSFGYCCPDQQYPAERCHHSR